MGFDGVYRGLIILVLKRVNGTPLYNINLFIFIGLIGLPLVNVVMIFLP
jgi:hypothetical protein